MVIAVIVCVLGLAAVLLAVYRDEPLAAPGPAPPDWDPVPPPADVGHAEFPLAFPGYSTTSVEVYLDHLRRAYEHLYASATPQVLERARQRALGDAGLEDAEPEDQPAWEPDEEDDPRRRESVLASVEPSEHDVATDRAEWERS